MNTWFEFPPEEAEEKDVVIQQVRARLRVPGSNLTQVKDFDYNVVSL